MDFISEMWGGPGHLRFFIQPLLAMLLGIRDGRNDAKSGRPPYVLDLLTHPETRRQHLSEGLAHLAIPMTIGVGMSLVLQWFIRNRVHLLAALLYGVLFIGLPYALARALTNRIVTRSRHRPAEVR